MKVALVDRSARLGWEWPTLRRLVVGLIDARISVVRVLPEGEHLDDYVAMTSEEVTYRGGGPRMLRNWNIRRLAEPLGELEPDVIHAMDGSLGRPAISLGQSLNVPVVVSVWSKAHADRLRPVHSTVPVAYAAASSVLADRCRSHAGAGAVVEHIPPGVFIRNDDAMPKPLDNPNQSLCCLVVGDGQADDSYQCLLNGMALVRDEFPQMMFFFYSMGTDQHRLWLEAKKLGLLERISIVPRDPSGGRMLVQADVVLHPQCGGVVRSLLLEAMGAGRPVIAADDPVADYLLNAQTARLMDEPTADKWAQCLRELVAQPQSFVRLGRAARDYVKGHHKVSSFVSQTFDLYQKLVDPGPLPFDNEELVAK